MAAAVRVVIAEDHFVTREGLRRLLEEPDGIEVVGVAGGAVDVLGPWAAVPATDAGVFDVRRPAGTAAGTMST